MDVYVKGILVVLVILVILWVLILSYGVGLYLGQEKIGWRGVMMLDKFSLWSLKMAMEVFWLRPVSEDFQKIGTEAILKEPFDKQIKIWLFLYR